jgi:hypothetical protein
LTGAGYFTGPTGATYTVTTNITSLKSWTAADFANNSTGLRLTAAKGTGSYSGNLNLDAAAFLVTTNQACSGSGLSLNPVPLNDTYPTAYFDFVSASLPPSSVSDATGTIVWNNVGPMRQANTEITVTLKEGSRGVCLQYCPCLNLSSLTDSTQQR